MDIHQHRARDLIADEKKETCGSDSARVYGKNHQKRFEILVNESLRCVPDRRAAVLDIGRSQLTEQLLRVYDSVTTLGFSLDDDTGGHREQRQLSTADHIEYDLRRAEDPDSWPSVENRFDLIMFSEVMEHLPTAPELVLLMFTRMLKPGGCILLSTPNRTTIRSRARMLIGRNPEKRIRCFSANPGHFREYTASELREIASAALLEVVFVRTINFNSPAGDIFAPLKVFPAFRDSLMAVFQRPR